MTGHLSPEQKGLYLRRALPPAELLAADDHLAACEACRRALRQEAAADRALAAMLGSFLAPEKTAAHLTYEQLAAYVDHESVAAEREAVEGHLSVCAQCKEEARDLFAFKESMAASPAQAVEPRREAGRAKWSLAALWHRAWHTNALRLSGAAAALLLVAGIAFWLFLKPAGTGEIAEVKPTPSPTASPGETRPTPSPSPEVRQEVEASNRTPQPAPVRTGPPPVAPAQPSATLVAVNDGPSRVAIDNRGRVEGLDLLSPEDRQAVRDALLSRRVERPDTLAGLEAKTGTLMGAPGAPTFGLQSPLGKVVRTATPTFRWQPLEGAASYTVNVYDTDFNKVATAGALGAAEWTPGQALERGRLYTWQVTAVKDGQEITSPAPPAPEAKFRILDDAQNRRLERAERLHRDSHLTLGVLYAQAGLLDEAERELQALADANPDSAPARELLKNVRALKQAK